MSWPDVLDGKASVEAGAGGSKSTDGSSKVDDEVNVSKDFTVYERKVNEKAAEPQAHQPWIDGMVIKNIVLTASAGGGSEDSKDVTGAKKSQNSGKVGLKAVATLENGATVTGDATLVSVKSDPPDVFGPNLVGTVALPVLETGWDLGEGWSAKASISASASLSIKPDWKALGREAGKLVLEMGVAGAIEMAATMAVIAAPILCMVSAISMIQDETELFHWLRKEAKEAQSAAIALAGGMTMAGSFDRNERDAKAYAAGQAAAQAAMASVGLDEQAYALAWKQNEGRRSAVIDQCWNSARATYDAAVDKRAGEVYNNSWSERFWKTESEFLATWRQKGYEAWPAKG